MKGGVSAEAALASATDDGQDYTSIVLLSDARSCPGRLVSSEAMPSDQLLTAEEVARLLQVRTSWLYDAARRGAIPHVRLGRYVRFRRDSVDAWIRERERRPSGRP
jgi:excisionase family DNA binding protein